MQFSGPISRISVSRTAAVLQMADQLKASGINLVDFGAGEPDFPTPANIKQAAIRALEQDFTKYTPTGGIRELKEAIVERHAQDFGSNYAVEECLVTVGGKQAIFESLVALLDEGDEVILPVPYWVSFLDIIRYAGGKAVLLETCEDDSFAVREAAHKKLQAQGTGILPTLREALKNDKLSTEARSRLETLVKTLAGTTQPAPKRPDELLPRRGVMVRDPLDLQ